MPRPGNSTGRSSPAELGDSPSSLFSPGFAANTAREAAFQTLELIREQSLWVASAWERVQSTAALSPIDRNLSRELAFGVIRRELTLDVFLKKFVQRDREKIEPPLLTILQLGLYQIFFANQIPPHAAVHETVELAKRVGRLRWSGFVNGVLRAASRIRTEEFTEIPEASTLPVGFALFPAAQPGEERQNSAQLPLRYRMLTEAVFPDPTTNLRGYFSHAYGFPEWLADRWVRRFTSDQLHRLGQWQRNPPPVFLRVNPLRTSRDGLLQEFRRAGLDAEPADLPEAIRVLSGGRIEHWPGYDAGLFSVQDLSAMQAARRLAPQPGSRILDLCAAPGGKACHLAELLQNSGEVVAVDVTPQRLERIVQNSTRLGLTAVQAVLAQEDGHDLPRGPFDFVLADVPCSNTGVIGRRPEVPRHLTLADIQELSRLQLELLHRAAERVRPGGRVVYSTCSIEHEENEEVVRQFLEQRPTFRLIEQELLLPGSPADGGYQALLERLS